MIFKTNDVNTKQRISINTEAITDVYLHRSGKSWVVEQDHKTNHQVSSNDIKDIANLMGVSLSATLH